MVTPMPTANYLKDLSDTSAKLATLADWGFAPGAIAFHEAVAAATSEQDAIAVLQAHKEYLEAVEKQLKSLLEYVTGALDTAYSLKDEAEAKDVPHEPA